MNSLGCFHDKERLIEKLLREEWVHCSNIV
jgi:hypothetical protein